ncbi:MAG: NAD(P)-dependent dehydrogenase (short-subunit alcohol dehydrogenase family) [Kiritimatiellia bacterium]|jgi:NAD(P)-dependent dehydrogenase (short-subunit alcohol dehydrogenase family)
MTRRGWSTQGIPDQSGRTVVITGANGGLGKETARAMAGRGARVVMACRNQDKGRAAVDDVRSTWPDSDLVLMKLDLANLTSVREFVDELTTAVDRVDLLINNAGVMALPYKLTADGFEMQLGTNHMGHFALTGLLLPRLIEAGGARVVTVSSQAHRMGKMNWNDLSYERGYNDWTAYGQSKLANLLFAFELDRLLRVAELDVHSLAAHPGYSDTDLQHVGPRERNSALMNRLMGLGNKLLAQSAEMGALPTLRAAADPDAQGGEYYGPGGLGEVRGPPIKVKARAAARNSVDMKRLWQVSLEATGVSFDALERASASS